MLDSQDWEPVVAVTPVLLVLRWFASSTLCELVRAPVWTQYKKLL